MSQGHLGGDAAPEAFAVGNDAFRGEPLGLQPSQRSFAVRVRAGFGWRSLALTVSPVVVGKDVQAKVEEQAVQREAVTDVAGIPVVYQHHELGAGRRFVGREVPAAEGESVRRGKSNRLPRAPQGVPGDRPLLGERVVDLVPFEPPEEQGKHEERGRQLGRAPNPASSSGRIALPSTSRWRRGDVHAM